MPPGPGPRSTSPPCATTCARCAPRRPGPALRGRQGQRLRPRRRARRRGRARRRRRLARRRAGRRGGGAAQRRHRGAGPGAVRAPARRGRLAIATGTRLTVYTSEGVAAIAKSVRAQRAAVSLHLNVDTGMHRVGAAPADMVALAKAVTDLAEVDLEGVCTHCPVADEPGNPYTAPADGPVRRGARRAAGVGHRPRRRRRRQLGRHARRPRVPLRPRALRHRRLRHPARRRLAGSSTSAGVRRWRPRCRSSRPSGRASASPTATTSGPRATVVATVPIGYADGVFRSLRGVQEVLIEGERRPIVGVVTMDQLMVDCGRRRRRPRRRRGRAPRRAGRQRITPDEWAARLGTISYEIVCAIGPAGRGGR